MTEQLPGLIIIVPFLGALLAGVLSIRYPSVLMPSSFLILSLNALFSIFLALTVVREGRLTYHLGGWEPPYGIEFVADGFSALFICLVALVSLMSFVNAKDYIPAGRQGTYYCTLYFLFLCGCQGMLLSGDVFNIYVFLEVAALSGYALLAFGDGRAMFACFRYLIIGSIGASFYLLGVGYLYLKTGSLNMSHVASIVPNVQNSHSLVAAFAFILVGLGVKMAVFPMHGWLSQVYTHTSPASRMLVAPLGTKISICIFVRLIFSVFGREFVFDELGWAPLMQVCACFAIVVGTIWAFAQTDLRRMVTYLMIVEVGYIFGGLWLGNSSGITGSLFHIGVDMVMTMGLFAALALYEEGGKPVHLGSLKFACQSHPLASAGLMFIMASMIGVPPFGGFVSKFYLIAGALEADQWPFVLSLLASSLCIALLFGRMLEQMLGLGDSEKTPAAILSPIRELSIFVIGAALLVMGISSSYLIKFLVVPILT